MTILQYITEEIQAQLFTDPTKAVTLPLYLTHESVKGEVLTEDYLSDIGDIAGESKAYQSIEFGRELVLESFWRIADWSKEFDVPSSRYKIKLHLHRYVTAFQVNKRKTNRIPYPINLRILEGDEITIKVAHNYLKAYEALLQFYKLRMAEVEVHYAAAKVAGKKARKIKNKTTDKWQALHKEWSEQLVEGDILKACVNSGNFNTTGFERRHQNGDLFKSNMLCWGYGLELHDIGRNILKGVTDYPNVEGMEIVDALELIEFIDFGGRLGAMDKPIVEFTFRKMGISEADIEARRQAIKERTDIKADAESQIDDLRSEYGLTLQNLQNQASKKAVEAKLHNRVEKWRNMPQYRAYFDNIETLATNAQKEYTKRIEPLFEILKASNATLSKLKTELNTWQNFPYFIERQDFNITHGQFTHTRELIESSIERYHGKEMTLAAKELASVMMGVMVSGGMKESEAAERAISLAGMLEANTSRGVSSLAWLLALVVRTRDEHLTLVPFDKLKAEDLAAHFEDLPFRIAVSVFRFFLTLMPNLQADTPMSFNSKTLSGHLPKNGASMD